MKIYFAGSIRGGRDLAGDYNKLISALSVNHAVLTEHIGDKEISSSGEVLLEKDIFKRDIDWINSADVVIAEVSVPSVGVGWEIGYAESLGKRIICLYNINSEKKISAMVEGNPNNQIIKYKTIDEAIEKLNELLV